MVKLPSLPEDAHLSDLFGMYSDNVPSLMAFTDGVLRQDGALPIAERELIAAFVSGLNACTFCFGSHKIYAEAFGIDEGVIEAVLDDLETAPISRGLKALLGYVAALNTLPAQVSQVQMDAVLAVGYSEKALFEAVQIAGLFNMMNRIIEGTGVSFDYTIDRSVHPTVRLGADARTHSYGGTPMGKPDRSGEGGS